MSGDAPVRRSGEAPDEWAARCYLHGYRVGHGAGERFAAHAAALATPSSLRHCPHCDAIGLGERALAKHIERRHGDEVARRVVLDPGAPRARVE